jgi:hypothetical protein
LIRELAEDRWRILAGNKRRGTEFGRRVKKNEEGLIREKRKGGWEIPSKDPKSGDQKRRRRRRKKRKKKKKKKTAVRADAMLVDKGD